MLLLRRTRVAPALLAAALVALPLGAQRRDTATSSSISAVDTSRGASLQAGIGSSVRAWNTVRLNEALAPHRRSWQRLTGPQRRQLEEAFDAILPGERFSRYRLNDAQARAIVYLAFGPERCASTGGGSASCATTTLRVADDANRVREAIVPLRRNVRVRLTRDRETVVLTDVVARSREIVLATARCGDCVAARDRAERLLAASRHALERHRESVHPAWMGVGDDRLAKLQELADDVEREALRCRR